MVVEKVLELGSKLFRGAECWVGHRADADLVWIDSELGRFFQFGLSCGGHDLVKLYVLLDLLDLHVIDLMPGEQ